MISSEKYHLKGVSEQRAKRRRKWDSEIMAYVTLTSITETFTYLLKPR